ncbi:hypothetical protein VTN00DRAFT_3801 [Thermoascus crustaceus]|uniref:uncharacterized protein n=1 Tax=Thermoascus crustaceus TaxID=5088 RepID=UPI00374401C9
MEMNSTQCYWAVLIGVNFHKNVNNRLHGCVNDVRNIQGCLEAISNTVDITTFTASNPVDPDGSHPTEEEAVWPSYENVVAGLERIIQHAKEGDIVYLQYSGHGTQIPGFPVDSNGDQSKGDFALILVDKVQGHSYFRGIDLAHMLVRMVKRGLQVTMVLDCCFSGSMPRHGYTDGASIRSVLYDLAFDRTASGWRHESRRIDQSSSSLRDARILPKWLIDPDGLWSSRTGL